MSFYQQISKYYDQIFPTGRDQVNFLREIAGKAPKAVLDIACGTGGYSLELASLGYSVTASDIDPKMMEQLKDKLKAASLEVECIQAGMLDLEVKTDKKFDLAFCIGNSIVHLNNKEEVQQFFNAVKQLLKKDGSFVMQIINFDRVLLKDIKELPSIKNDETGLIFERYYRYEKDINKIFFKTILTVEDQKLENEIPLFPLQSEDAFEMLKNAGFRKFKLFGDFNGSGFDKYNSFMLVLWAA